MTIITKIKNLFSSKDVLKEPNQTSVADDIISTASETIEEDNPFSEPEPVVSEEKTTAEEIVDESKSE